MNELNIKRIYQQRLSSLENIGRECGMDLAGYETFKGILNRESFDIIFAGEFTAGKSTLINALLGADILPTALEATTARITFISYSDRPGVTLHFKDGRSEDLQFSPSILKEYIASNLPKIENVEYVYLRYPSELLKNGIRFIDTPGTNDTETQRVDITYRIVPEADAVVYVTIYPVTENNLCTLNELVIENHILNVFYVLNKLDLIDNQLEDALADAKQWFEQKTGSEIQLYPISALDYLEGVMNDDSGLIEKSRMAPLLDDLANFIKGSEKHLRQEKQFDYQLNKLKKQTSELITLKIAGLSLPEGEFEQKTVMLEKNLSCYMKTADDLRADMVNEFNRLSSRLDKSLDKMLVDLLDEIELKFAQGTPDDRVLIRSIEMSIKNRYEAWMLRNEPIIRDYLETITQESHKRLGAVVNSLNLSLMEYFGGFKVHAPVDELGASTVDERKATATIGIVSLGAYAALAIAHVTLAPLAILLGPIGIYMFHEKRKQEREILKERFMHEIQKSSQLFKDEILKNVLSLQHVLLTEIKDSISTFSEMTQKQLSSIREERKTLKNEIDAKITHLEQQTRSIAGI